MMESKMQERIEAGLKLYEAMEAEIADRYPLPPPEAGFRLLEHGEMPIDGDEVWNFHFKQWCDYRQIVDAAVDEMKERGAPLRYVNPLVMSPRLSLIRRKVNVT